MKKFLSFLLVIICCVFFASTGFAHPGGTDADGGHYVSNTGEYHYHHGYPAHGHPNGICPYGNKNISSYHSEEKQEESNYYSGNSGNSKKDNSYSNSSKVDNDKKALSTEDAPFAISLIRSVFYSLTLSILVTYIYGLVTREIITNKCGIKETPKKIQIFLTQKPLVIVYICISITCFIVLKFSNVTGFWYNSLDNVLDLLSNDPTWALPFPFAVYYITKFFLYLAHCNFFCSFRGKTCLFVFLGIIVALSSTDILFLLLFLIAS